MTKQIELMTPVGSFAALKAGITAGANSVYFGVSKLNMRSHSAQNFTLEDLAEIVSSCQKAQVKTYVTLNTIIYDEDLPLMQETCDQIKKCGASAIIASDLATITYAHSIGLNVHISTQANISNIEAVKFFSKYASTMVLARELTLEQIASICQAIQAENIRGPSGKLIQIEIFVHGALCVAISGKCYMSLSLYNKSANRGACLQACRRKYKIIDEETNQELLIDNQYVMSPKDLCTIKFLDQIVRAGVSILKIEGRGRSPEYVKVITEVYREALDAITSGTYNPQKFQPWITRLESVYNRGFWHGGYYCSKHLEEWCGTYGSQSTKQKVYVGKVAHYFSQKKIAEIKIEALSLKVGDNILIIGATTGVLEFTITTLLSHAAGTDGQPGQFVTINTPEVVRYNDKVFLTQARTPQQ